MQIINLYKYQRADGGTTVSPTKPDVEYTKMYRLVADEGKAVTNGEIVVSCVDVESIEGWSEIEGTEEAIEQDYQNALTDLGVEFNA